MRFYRVNKEGASVLDIPNKLDEINNALGWTDAWNTPTIQICGRKYILICSDLGKVQHLPISALCRSNLITPKETIQEPFMVGTIIITKFDGIDDFEALNDEDLAILQSRTIDAHYFGIDSYNKILVID